MKESGSSVAHRGLATAILDAMALAKNSPRKRGQLKEYEVQTLEIIKHHGRITVGNIQKTLGILPAQMTRIMRAFRKRNKPLINYEKGDDGRVRIISLTPDGEKMLVEACAQIHERLAHVFHQNPALVSTIAKTSAQADQESQSHQPDMQNSEPAFENERAEAVATH